MRSTWAANAQLLYLHRGRRFHPVPHGWPGEILTGGLGVGQGYLNQPELSAKAFIPDTFASAEQKARVSPRCSAAATEADCAQTGPSQLHVPRNSPRLLAPPLIRCPTLRKTAALQLYHDTGISFNLRSCSPVLCFEFR